MANVDHLLTELGEMARYFADHPDGPLDEATSGGIPKVLPAEKWHQSPLLRDLSGKARSIELASPWWRRQVASGTRTLATYIGFMRLQADAAARGLPELGSPIEAWIKLSRLAKVATSAGGQDTALVGRLFAGFLAVADRVLREGGHGVGLMPSTALLVGAVYLLSHFLNEVPCEAGSPLSANA